MTAFTLAHVLISLMAILSGFAVLFGLLAAKRLEGWTALFLATTVLTSVTGFFFPFHGITPAIVVGLISLVVLAVAIFACYTRNLSGVWRKTYGWRARLMISSSFSKSSREGFWPERVRKKTGSWETSS